MPPRPKHAGQRGRLAVAVDVEPVVAAIAPADHEPIAAAVAAAAEVTPAELAPTPAVVVAVDAVAHADLVPTAAVAAVNAVAVATVADGMPPSDAAAVDAGAAVATVAHVMPSIDDAGIGAGAAGTPPSGSPGEADVPGASHIDVVLATSSAPGPPAVRLMADLPSRLRRPVHGSPGVAVAAAPSTASGLECSSITAGAGHGCTAVSTASATDPDYHSVPTLNTEPMIRQAAAFRIKYRQVGSPFRFPVEMVGFHPCNRDGQPPNGMRCLELCKDILSIGYDSGEADSGGIVVQEKPGSTRLHEFNTLACADDPLLSAVAGCISYGSLSHSHLHQILRNIKFGAKCTGLPAVAGTDDCFSMDLLRSVDPSFAHAAVTGLSWEVLSWKIEEEEPQACSIIQAAMNAKNGLFLLRHEMQAVASISTMLASSAVVEQRLSVEVARVHLHTTLPEFATDDNFVDLFRFCLDLGGSSAGFLHDARQFHERFVDPKCRRLRLAIFGHLNALPLEFPYLKIAGLKYVYASAALENGYCKVPALKMFTALVKPDMEQTSAVAEDVLRHFHVHGVKDSKLSIGDKVKFFGNLDKDIFKALAAPCEEPSPELRRQRILHLAGSSQTRLLQLSHAVAGDVPKLPFTVPADGKSSPTQKTLLQPRVIIFNDGKAITTQDSLVHAPVLEKFAWGAFMQSSDVHNALTTDAMRSAVVAATLGLASDLGMETVYNTVGIVKNGEHKKIRVLAARNIATVGQVVLAPLTQSVLRVVESAAQGWAPEVKVTTLGTTKSFFLTTTSSLPAIDAAFAAVAAPALADGSGGAAVAAQAPRLCEHLWKPTHNPWPFWAMRRSESRDGTNFELSRVTTNSLFTFHQEGWMDPHVHAFEIELPVLVNTAAVNITDELVAYWPTRQQPTKKKATKATTWVEQASKKKKTA